MTSQALSALHGTTLLAAVCLLSAALPGVGCMEDSVLGDDELYMSDRVEEEEPVEQTLTPNGCDMTGTWIAQFRGRSEALSFVVRNYNWFYYELESDGDDLIIHRGWDCGVQVCGATSAALSDIQFDALTLRNRQDGELFHNAASPNDSLVVEQRRASYKNLGDSTCEFEMGRWWWLRSAPLDRYPARDTYATMTIAQIKAERPLPPKGTPVSPENDWDGNDVPGLELNVDTPMQGTRDTAQRDWNEFGPALLPDGLSDFTVEARFDNEELIYKTSHGLLNRLSTPLKAGITVRFVKISENAPEDLKGFRTFCKRQVNEHFRREDMGDQYCGMRAQELTKLP